MAATAVDVGNGPAPTHADLGAVYSAGALPAQTYAHTHLTMGHMVHAHVLTGVVGGR
jgi:hypothetical protein